LTIKPRQSLTEAEKIRRKKAYYQANRGKISQKNKTLVVKFKGKEMAVSDYQTGEYIETMQIPTLKLVKYDKG